MEANTPDTLGGRIARLRKEKGMTQLELADRMGVTDKAVSKWERDVSCPDIASMPRLAEVLGATVDELMQARPGAAAPRPKPAGKQAGRLVELTLKGVAAAMGIAVAVFIAFTGFSILKDTVSRLLGKAPDRETVQEIEKRVLAFDGVRGLHDLTVHNYGQNKLYATVHVEVDSRMPIMDAHDLADRIEKDFARNTGIEMTVHIDPLVYDDPKINQWREEVCAVAAELGENLRVHDFRAVGGKTHTNLVFDVAVPFECKLSDAEILQRLKDRVALLGENLDAVANIERQNVE